MADRRDPESSNPRTGELEEPRESYAVFGQPPGQMAAGPEEGAGAVTTTRPADAGEGSPATERFAPWAGLSFLDRYPKEIGLVGGIVVLTLVVAMAFFLDGSPTITQGSRPLGNPDIGALTTTPSSSTTVPAGGSGLTPAAAAARPSPTSSSVASGASGSVSLPTTGTAKSETAAASATRSTTPGSADTSSGPTPTTAPSPAPSGSPGEQTDSMPGLCKPSDFTITTTTDSPSYSPGSDVTVTSKLMDESACAYAPVPEGQYACPTTIVIVDSAGSQVYPVPGQLERCAYIVPGVLEPGEVMTVKFVWGQQQMSSASLGQAPPGQYEADATWCWSSGGTGTPQRETVDSAPFTIA